MKIFWSWQSDTPPASGRDFVKSALSEAIEQMAEELALSEAERPELDHDTKDVPGLAPIADTIFDKIDSAALFVADVTLTGATTDGEKRTPNPNVLIELGYALKALGTERIVLVANSAGGFRPEDLPFDLRHRRGPITYELGARPDKDATSKVKKALVKELASALRNNLGSFAPGPDVEPPQYPSVPEDRAIWFTPTQSIGLHDTVTGKLHPGTARAYLRVAASGWTGNKPTRLDIQRKSIAPFGQWNHGSAPVPNELGVLSGGWARSEDEVTALTQWFDKTAELWGMSPVYGFERDGIRQLATVALAKQWRARLREWIALFEQLGARKPLRVEAGITGIQGIVWPGDAFFGRQKCMDTDVVHVRSDKDWSDDAQLRFLTDVFGKICDSFAIERLQLEQVAAMTS
jgi:hypothetical protein